MSEVITSVGPCWKFFTLMYYCSEILEMKDMSDALNQDLVSSLYTRFPVRCETFTSMKGAT